MLIGEDSPLRRLPSGLDLRQKLFLDAIRHSAEMADISYLRLQDTLLSLSNDRIEAEKIAEIGRSGINALLDAWSIVDSIHRLRGLLKHLPFMKQKSPGIIAFYKATAKVEPLRHIIQHINKEIEQLVVNQAPVLGSLSWFVRPESSRGKIFLFNFQPGSVFTRSVPIITMPHIIGYPIDRITLNHNQSLCINDIMDKVGELISSIESQLQNQITGFPQSGSDILLMMAIKEGDEVDQ